MDTPRTDHDDAAIAAANDAVSDAYASPGTPARVLQAVDQARDAKYQARYGDDPVTRWVSLAAPAQPTGAPPSAEAAEGPDPAIASMGAATLRARISAIRGLLKEVTDIEDERVLLTDMHACYARLYPEPTAGEEAPPAPARSGGKVLRLVGRAARAPRHPARTRPRLRRRRARRASASGGKRRHPA
jgi:hypothetical protein